MLQVLPHDPNSTYIPPVPLPVPVVDPAAAVDAVAQSLGATMEQLQDPESCLVSLTECVVVALIYRLLNDTCVMR